MKTSKMILFCLKLFSLHMLWNNTMNRNTFNLIENKSYAYTHKYGTSLWHIWKTSCQYQHQTVWEALLSLYTYIDR